MEIITLQKKDLKNALDLVWQVFLEFEAPDYAPQGIETFKDFISYDSAVEKYDNKELLFWGCLVDDRLAGVLAVRDISHICLLFVAKEYHRQGIARMLFNAALEHCRKDTRVKRITVNASPYAVEAYRHLGFKDQSAEQTLNGIRFTPMEYLFK